VRRQMVADVPVGAFLSGGLDSSAIVASAKATLGDRPLKCFTIGFREGTFAQEGFADDLPHAKRVAAHLNVDLEVVQVGPELIDRLPAALFHMDEPQADPALLNVWCIAELARSAGIKVLLSGSGGDDLFSGYARHWAQDLERWWAWAPHRTRRILRRLSRRIPTRSPMGRRLSRALSYADADPRGRWVGYFRWLDDAQQRSLYGPRLREVPHQPELPLLQTLERLSPEVHPLNQLLYLEAKHFLADHNLPYTDKMSMAASIEVRVPYLDPDLVALATQIPPQLKQRGRTGKWILKQAMAPRLPADIIHRSKTGFGTPLRTWLSGRLRPQIQEVLSSEALRARGLFDPAAVQRLIKQDRAGHIDAAYPIFQLFCLELWCRTFLDVSVPTAPS